jgi:molybdenum cofactor synthesis domain-containing protein
VNASAVVITISTGIVAGQRADSSGGTLRDGLAQLGLTVSDGGIIRDDRLKIQQAVLRFCDFEPVSLLLFTGGTGPTPDDVTPEAIVPLLDRRYEGIENAIHDDGRSSTPRAPMSRLVAGARGRTVIIALPGSPGACTDALKTLAPFLMHLLSLTAGTFDPH